MTQKIGSLKIYCFVVPNNCIIAAKWEPFVRTNKFLLFRQLPLLVTSKMEGDSVNTSESSFYIGRPRNMFQVEVLNLS